MNNWCKAAVADGWVATPLYENEPINHAAKLTRDGWIVQAIDRPNQRSSMNIWAPDRLAIKVPETYSMVELIKRLRWCHYCDSKDVNTQRVSFAGRCCTECLLEQQKIQEYRGWAD